MIGAMAAFPIPDFSKRELANLALQPEPLRGRLVREFGIEVPSTPWPAPPKRLLRISAQIYNSLPQYERLASVLKVVFNRRRA
jgi:isopenicillin-N epimerase